MRTEPAPPPRPRPPPAGARGRWAALPNRLSTARLAMVPLLWVVALLRETTALGIGVALAALTDVADGIIARRFRSSTSLGSRLDSIADHALTTSVALWIVWLRPEVVREHLVLLGAWAALGGAALLVGWIRFRRVGDLHLYSAKLAGTAGYLFAVWLLVFGSYPRWVFYLVAALGMVAALETLIALAVRPSVDEHIGSILLRRRRRRRER